MDKKNGRNGRKARRGGTGKQDTCTNREAGCCYLKEDFTLKLLFLSGSLYCVNLTAMNREDTQCLMN